MVKINPTRRDALLQRYAKDVLRDPLYSLLEQGWNWVALIALSWILFFAVAFGVAIATGASAADALQFGASILVWGVFVRTVLVFQDTMSVNSITHLWGYRNYDTNDNSKNNIFVGIFASGEGWHNNHHADPNAAMHGHRWWELDLPWSTIRMLQKMGLAWDIKLPAPHLLAGAKSRS
jgi:stearoyl-CoA desaturase (delta-9 desaturase)